VQDFEVKLGVAEYKQVHEHKEFSEKTLEQFKEEIRQEKPADVMVNGKVDEDKVTHRAQEKVDLQNDIKSAAHDLGLE